MSDDGETRNQSLYCFIIKCKAAVRGIVRLRTSQNAGFHVGGPAFKSHTAFFLFLFFNAKLVLFFFIVEACKIK